MNFILDFDWTLFDNNVVRQFLEKQGRFDAWKHAETWDLVNSSDCFYSDVIPWLSGKSKETLHILTAYQGPEYSYDAEDFQKIKVQRSGIEAYVSSVTFMMGDKKDCIESLLDKNDINVFLDDTISQLEGVKDQFPEVYCIRMRRENASYAHTQMDRTDIPEVKDLAEFDGIIQTL